MPALYATAREDGVITVVDLSGRIALGEGSALLRKTIRELAGRGQNEDHSEPRGRELHRQLGDWRAGERIHGGAQSARRIEAAASDKESARPCCKSPNCSPFSTCILTRATAVQKLPVSSARIVSPTATVVRSRCAKIPRCSVNFTQT